MDDSMQVGDIADEDPSPKTNGLLNLTSDEWEQFSESIVDLLVSIEDFELTNIQCMVLWVVNAAKERGKPYDKTSIAQRIKKPRQTVARHIDSLEKMGWLRTERVGHQELVYMTDQTPPIAGCPVGAQVVRSARVLLQSRDPFMRRELDGMLSNLEDA